MKRFMNKKVAAVGLAAGTRPGHRPVRLSRTSPQLETALGR